MCKHFAKLFCIGAHLEAYPSLFIDSLLDALGSDTRSYLAVGLKGLGIIVEYCISAKGSQVT